MKDMGKVYAVIVQIKGKGMQSLVSLIFHPYSFFDFFPLLQGQCA